MLEIDLGQFECWRQTLNSLAEWCRQTLDSLNGGDRAWAVSMVEIDAGHFN